MYVVDDVGYYCVLGDVFVGWGVVVGYGVVFVVVVGWSFVLCGWVM